jgi:hypothetical protein
VTTSARRARSTAGMVPAAAAVVWTLIALVGFAVLPFYSTASGGESSDGTSWSTTGEETLIEHEGLGVLLVLLVPVALTFFGLVGVAFGIRFLTIGAAVTVWALCVLGMASIGFFYLPAAVLLVVAAVRSRQAASGPRSRDGRASWQRHLLLAFCAWWTVGVFLLAGVGISQANDDARVLVVVATVVGVGAAAASVGLVLTDRLRWAGLALIISAVTPTWAAAIVSLPALIVGAGLVALARPAESDVTSVR